jgi:diguanylate cyclase (GGDEF)-like protein
MNSKKKGSLRRTMEKEIDKVRLQYRISRFTNIMLISVHVLMTILFFALRTYYLAFINIGSVITYSVCFSLLNKHKLAVFINTLHIEIWIQMIACIMLLGWGFGFELFSFGLVFTLFFVTYTSTSSRKFSFHPMLLCTITTAVYISLRIYSYDARPYYTGFASWIPRVTYIVISLFIFITIVVFMFLYTDIVLRAERELRSRADYDELTSLYNRHKIRDVLGLVYDEALNGKNTFCVAIMDIDDFKLINDTYGHDAGDIALASVASIIKKHDNTFTTVCRWGGEEFLIVQQYTGSIEGAVDIIESIRTEVATTVFQYDHSTFPLTITAGISPYIPGTSIADTIRRADKELYRGKLTGKNKVIVSK